MRAAAARVLVHVAKLETKCVLSGETGVLGEIIEHKFNPSRERKPRAEPGYLILCMPPSKHILSPTLKPRILY